MKKKKNAFTLIELLAIIVILAIIAVITVPIILNIIENSRKGAATDSAYGYKDAVNKYYVTELANNRQLQLEGTYIITDGVLDGNGISNKEVPVSGEKPSSGYVIYSNNTLTTGCLTIGDYKVTFTDGSVSETIKGDCPLPYVYRAYYNEDNGESADDIDIVLSRPEGEDAYLRYISTNGEVADGTVPEVCTYNSTYGGELCLKNNDYIGSKKKIIDYFKLTYEVVGYSYSGNSQYTNVSCFVTEGMTNHDDNYGILCYDSDVYVEADSTGTVRMADYNPSNLICDVNPDNSVSCYYNG